MHHSKALHIFSRFLLPPRQLVQSRLTGLVYNTNRINPNMSHVRIATEVNTMKYQSRRIACTDYMNFPVQDAGESLFSLLISGV